jgi:hypothetical protein
MAKAKDSLNKLKQSVAAVAAPEFKVDMKHVSALVKPLISAIQHAHVGVRDVLVMWLGERPETLDKVKEQVRADMKAWLKDEGRNVNPQSVYNMQSDIMAVCNAYSRYAGFDAKRQATFKKHHSEASSYHTLVKLCRDTVKGKKGEQVAPEKALVKRIKSGWKNHQKDMAKKTKDMLRYAPTDALLSLSDFIEGLIKARKTGAVEALRKAA